MTTAFDNDKYIRIQSENIRERIGQFDNKLYLELGGKLFDDLHASRVLPGFIGLTGDPDRALGRRYRAKQGAPGLGYYLR